MEGLTPPHPLAGDDDREGFDCGRASLNQWFQRHAWRNQQSSVSRTSVVCDTQTREISGFISLSAGQIERAYLPKVAQRNQSDPLGVILLGQLAVDQHRQGRGIARSLVWFALSTAVRISREIGCFGVVTHPLDNELRAFYGRFGFEELPFDPRHAMIVRIVDLENNGF
jgi:predicted N-acetyltransferase YhbS